MTHEDAERSQRATYGTPPIWDPLHETWTAPGGEVPAQHYRMNQGPGWGAYGHQSAPPPPIPPQHSMGGVGDSKPPQRKRRWPWVVALVVVALIGLGSLIGSSNGGPAERREVGVGASAPADPAQSPVTEVPAQPKKWYTVASLSGSGYKSGKPFALGDGQYRLRYSVKSTNAEVGCVFAVYLLDKGTSFDVDGGIPLAMEVDSAKSEVTVTGPAESFIHVIASNANWQVSVEEYK